jgi:GH43 family beta-xylosidase
MTLSDPHRRPVTTARAYTNPLPFAGGQRPTHPDPFGFQHQGVYYCYASGETGVRLSRSPDLVAWDYLGEVAGRPGRREYWAPCVYYHDGLFYLYVSSAPEDSDDPHDEVLSVATATTPTGPFEHVKTLFDEFSIDPHVVRDPAGELYLFYASNRFTGLDPTRPGTSIVVDRLLDPLTPAGRPRPIVVPTLDEEIFARNRFGDGRDWHTIEGPTFFRHGAQAFVTYSGNAYVRPAYFVGYARAGDGPIGGLSFAKYPSDSGYAPLIARTAAVEGTGHNSIVTAPNLVDQWILYHGRDAAEPLVEGTEQRTMRLDPLFFDGRRLATPAPSHEPQDAPSLPDLACPFTAGLGPEWTVVQGRFAGDGEAVTTTADPALAVTRRRFGTYVAELSWAVERGHAGARWGFAPVWLGDDDQLAIDFDAGRGTATARRIRRGLSHELAQADLPAMDWAAFHHLRVRRTIDRVDVDLDGLPLLACPAPAGPAHVGLTSAATAARFAGFALTEHLALAGADLRHAQVSADPPATVTAAGIGPADTRPLVLTGPPLRPAWSFEVSLELLDRRAHATWWPAGPAAGLALTAQDGRARLTRRDGAAETELAAADLPEPAFTWAALPTPAGLLLRLGPVTYLAEGPVPDNPGRLELAHAVLAGVTATSHAADYPTQTPPPDHDPSTSRSPERTQL